MLVLKGITCVDNCKEKKRKNIKTTYKKCVCVCVGEFKSQRRTK